MLKKLPLIILFVFAAFLRFTYLGYSDYQGDETKALYNPTEAKSLKFFLEQRKGPAQFLVTAALRNFSNGYTDRLLLRLPFALAGFGSVVVFYFLTKELFNSKVAFYSTMFIATNGFFIAFSRIVQYQSLVIFFGLLAAYLALKYSRIPRLIYLVTGAICWAVSILAHYDGIFFAPLIVGLLSLTVVKAKDGTERYKIIKHVVVSALIFLILSGAFYVPFALNIAQDTKAYWAGRISGDVSGKISSSRYLFSVYQPIYAYRIYCILGYMGLFLLNFMVIYRNKKPLKPSDNNFRLAHKSFSTLSLLSITLWWFIPFFLLEVLIHIPGTHIYSYLIPTFLFMGFALFHLDIISRKILKNVSVLFTGGVWMLFIFLFLQSYSIFVDHTYEYPWENKRFLLWDLHKPVTVYHLSLFGFPYHRYWPEIASFIKQDAKSKYYSTNERTTMPDYYVPLEKDSKNMGYYIYIHRPQKLIDGLSNKRVIRYASENPPLRTYYNGSRVVSEIYLLPKDSPSIPKEEFAKYGITDSDD